MIRILTMVLLIGVTKVSVLSQPSLDATCREISFPSSDGLMISAKICIVSEKSPTIILCHQAGSNKFEYDGIAKELNSRGFNSLAVDLRMGGDLSSVHNQTYLTALQEGKPRDLSGSERDMVAAIEYVSNTIKAPIILWGSSYTATLALYIGKTNASISAVVSFSPGNYLAASKGSLQELLPAFGKPFLITGGKQEVPALKELLEKVQPDSSHVFFQPASMGRHGSSSLWDYPYDKNEYWRAVDKFLAALHYKTR